MSYYIANSHPDLEKIIQDVCKRENIPMTIGKEAVWNMFKLIRDRIRDKVLESVRYQHLGTFGISPKKMKLYTKRWKKS